jgi:Uma2 family endonuclease
MTTATELLTADDLLKKPHDGYRYELVKGELIRVPPAGNIHGQRAMRLGWRLARHVESNDLGVVFAAETGFRLATDPDTVRAPDVAFVTRTRIEEAGEFEGFWPGAILRSSLKTTRSKMKTSSQDSVVPSPRFSPNQIG